MSIKPFSERFADSWCVPGSMWAFVLVLILSALTAQGAPTPSPTPYTISDADIMNISRAEMAATVKHLIAINKELSATVATQKDHLADATLANTQALNAASVSLLASAQSLTALTTLQDHITALAKHDKAETDRANKLAKAVWWYRLHWWGAWIALGTGLLAIGFFAFLWWTGKLAKFGTAVASKIP